MAMKWILVRDGTYKYVEDSDPRPRVSLPSKGFSSSIFTKFIPSWGKYEKDMWNTNDKISRRASDMFALERDHAIKTDPKAKRWEEGRKASWAKDKPLWAKKQAKGEI